MLILDSEEDTVLVSCTFSFFNGVPWASNVLNSSFDFLIVPWQALQPPEIDAMESFKSSDGGQEGAWLDRAALQKYF